jgi:hypothetical protein
VCDLPHSRTDDRLARSLLVHAKRDELMMRETVEQEHLRRPLGNDFLARLSDMK